MGFSIRHLPSYRCTKQVTLAVCSVCVAFLISVDSSAQPNLDWLPINDGLEGDQIDLLWASRNGTYFSGGSVSGLFRSNGINEPWHATTLTKGYVKVMTEDVSGRIYAGTNEGLYVSIDQGMTWDLTSIKIPVYSLEVLPTGIVFAGTIEGVFRLKGIDHSWELVKQWELGGACLGKDDLNPSPICTMTATSDSSLIVAAEGSLFTTKDGDSWNCFNKVIGNKCVTFVDPITSTPTEVTHLEAIGEDFLVKLGDTCEILRFSAGDSLFEFSGLSGGIHNYTHTNNSIIVAMKGASGASCQFQGGIYESQNLGKSWMIVEPDSLGIFSVLADTEGEWICTGTGGGVHCSDDQALTWSAWNKGLKNAEVESLLITKQGNLFAGTLSGAIIPLNEADPQWEFMSLPTSSACLPTPSAFIQSNDGVIFASRGNLGANVYRSFDQGATWEEAPQADHHFLKTAEITKSSTDRNVSVVCGTTILKDPYLNSSCPSWMLRQPIFVSTGEYTYHVVRNVVRSSDNFSTVERFSIDDALGFVQGSQRSLAENFDGEVIVSAWKHIIKIEKDFQDWTLLYSGESTIQDIDIPKSNIILAATSDGILRSTDGGITWDSPLFKDECFNSIESNSEGVVVVDTKYVSFDSGLTWNLFADNLPGQVLSLTFDSTGVLYAGTQGWGIFKSSRPYQTQIERNEYAGFLAEVYPNPSRRNVFLSLNLEFPDHIVIEIFDALGRKISSRNMGTLQDGRHRIPINDLGIFPGVYVIRVRAGNKKVDLPHTVVD